MLAECVSPPGGAVTHLCLHIRVFAHSEKAVLHQILVAVLGDLRMGREQGKCVPATIPTCFAWSFQKHLILNA